MSIRAGQVFCNRRVRERVVALLDSHARHDLSQEHLIQQVNVHFAHQVGERVRPGIGVAGYRELVSR